MENQTHNYGKFFVNIIKNMILGFVIIILVSVLVSLLILSKGCENHKQANEYNYYVDKGNKSPQEYVMIKLKNKYKSEFSIVDVETQKTSICKTGFIDSGCLKSVDAGEEYVFTVRDKNNVYFFAVYKYAFYLDYYNSDGKIHYDSDYGDNYKNILDFNGGPNYKNLIGSEFNELFNLTKEFAKEKINTTNMYFVPTIASKNNINYSSDKITLIIETSEDKIDEKIIEEIKEFYEKTYKDINGNYYLYSNIIIKIIYI